MSFDDALRLVARVAHLAAMAVWLGGGLLYLLFRGQRWPSANGEAPGTFNRAARATLGRAFAITAASGVYLMLDRLSDPRVSWWYVGALGLKLGVVAAIVWMLGTRRRPSEAQPRAWWAHQGWWTLALGTAALTIGVALTLIYEAGASKPNAYV